MTRVAVVVGGGSGIGQAIAVALARAGATVVAAGRHLERVEETVSLGRGASGGVHAEQVDVHDPATLHALAERVRAAHGPATVLVNSAGEHLAKPALDVTTEEWDAVQGTQLRGVFFACQAFGRQMAERGYGKIVNLGSTWGTIAGPGRSVYGIAKAGVAHLTTCLAVEWGPLGIRVNAVAPGATLTAAARARLDQNPGRQQAMVGRTPLGRLAQPDDVVGAALFLAGPESDFVTGETLHVDGGWRFAT